MPNAHKLGRLNGRNVYRFPVRVRLNNSHTLAMAEHWYTVTAHSAADAADLIRDEWSTRAETEITAYGPRGGKTDRYIGWESAIWAAMQENRGAAAQGDLLPAATFEEIVR